MSAKSESLFAHGEFLNVRLTPLEYQRLLDRFGNSAHEWIEALSVGKAAHGYKYKSDYAAILTWSRREQQKKVIKEPVIARLSHPDPLCCLEHSGLSDEEFERYWKE